MADSKVIDLPCNLMEKITKLLMDLLSEIPLSNEAQSRSPRARARNLALEAGVKAVGGALAKVINFRIT